MKENPKKNMKLFTMWLDEQDTKFVKDAKQCINDQELESSILEILGEIFYNALQKEHFKYNNKPII